MVGKLFRLVSLSISVQPSSLTLWGSWFISTMWGHRSSTVPVGGQTMSKKSRALSATKYSLLHIYGFTLDSFWCFWHGVWMGSFGPVVVSPLWVSCFSHPKYSFKHWNFLGGFSQNWIGKKFWFESYVFIEMVISVSVVLTVYNSIGIDHCNIFHFQHFNVIWR